MGLWRRCAVCKKEINNGAIYQVCSVSTCKKHVYCSVDCWNEHTSVMNHKSAWAEEEIAPQQSESDGDERSPRRIIVQSGPKESSVPKDVLIVVSKLKAYVKAKHDCNTSGNVSDILSDYVRRLCDEACENARMDGRKTLMDRDFR